MLARTFGGPALKWIECEVERISTFRMTSAWRKGRPYTLP